ncbi:hypothetical protein K437DRAFT_276113 [Tilletiaria anomala UBC 951]|uniref:Uncharacterized protein n=1 Tax=Tilletiaria anomala (strain ATCC 24038 / CBS 436.72 / UBC 951) TaxID=1037660 RepID=A0A066VC66_TILAU|nr:uncharacterized protein K437DRAFT_276113 [Tilletiaria anomala UBC 951]KDN39081.1 hypothetical protein K437DRAFT_276113 [Tilletiaria anomala UBC 951]
MSVAPVARGSASGHLLACFVGNSRSNQGKRCLQTREVYRFSAILEQPQITSGRVCGTGRVAWPQAGHSSHDSRDTATDRRISVDRQYSSNAPHATTSISPPYPSENNITQSESGLSHVHEGVQILCKFLKGAEPLKSPSRKLERLKAASQYLHDLLEVTPDSPYKHAEVNALVDAAARTRALTGQSLGYKASSRLIDEVTRSGLPEVALQLIARREKFGVDYSLSMLIIIQRALFKKLNRSEEWTLRDSLDLPGAPKREGENAVGRGAALTQQLKTGELDEERKWEPAPDQVAGLACKQSIVDRMRLVAALAPIVNSSKHDFTLLSLLFSAHVGLLRFSATIAQPHPFKHSSDLLRDERQRPFDHLLRIFVNAAAAGLPAAASKTKAKSTESGMNPGLRLELVDDCLQYCLMRFDSGSSAALAGKGAPEAIRTLYSYLEKFYPEAGSEIIAQTEAQLDEIWQTHFGAAVS